MPRATIACSFVAILSLSLACLGCSSGGDQVPVEGVVTLNGQALTGVQVTFDQPELGPKENKGYIARTDEQGRFVLRPAMGEGAGAPPGTYRVSMTTAVFDPSAPPPKAPAAGSTTIFFPESAPLPPERIPPAYRNGKLTFEVPSGGTTSADFKLVSK